MRTAQALFEQLKADARDLQTGGPDPAILPDGIAPSSDPLLAARSSTYHVSLELRTWEQATAPTDGQ